MQLKKMSQKIKLELLRTLTLPNPDGTYYDQDRYLLKDVSAISPDTIKLLLELMPFFVTMPHRKTHQVIFGSRLFSVAAQVLEPSYEVTVNVIQKGNDDLITHLRYLDLTVFSVLETLNLSALDAYNLINVPEQLPKAWQVPSKAAFAEMLGVSRSLLSTKPKTNKTS